MEETKFKFPTEIVELPSKGLVYPSTSALSSGKIEMKYMTAREEDILSNQSYIQKGTVLDKLMKSLIVSDINYDDLVVGDKNAIMVAARILGYGADYTFKYEEEEITVDLSELGSIYLDESCKTQDSSLLISSSELNKKLNDPTIEIVSVLNNLDASIPFNVNQKIPFKDFDVNKFIPDFNKNYVIICNRGITSYDVTLKIKTKFPMLDF